MCTLLYPNLPRNEAHEREAEPAPIKAILVFATFGSRGLRFGSLICFTLIYLKVLQANSCSLPISIVPPSNQ